MRTSRSTAPEAGSARLRRAVGALCLCAALVGCAPGGSGGTEAADGARAGVVPQAEAAEAPDQDTAGRMRADDPAQDFEAQPRMLRLQRDVPAELGWRPGTTAWRPLEQGLPPQLMRNALTDLHSPAALVHGVLGLLGPEGGLEEGVWEQTTRIRRDGDDRATAVVLQWGGGDDSVAGHDLRIAMRQAEAGWWYVERVEERFQCQRGVTPDGLCV
jgi:hypothetical protein